MPAIIHSWLGGTPIQRRQGSSLPRRRWRKEKWTLNIRQCSGNGNRNYGTIAAAIRVRSPSVPPKRLEIALADCFRADKGGGIWKLSNLQHIVRVNATAADGIKAAFGSGRPAQFLNFGLNELNKFSVIFSRAASVHSLFKFTSFSEHYAAKCKFCTGWIDRSRITGISKKLSISQQVKACQWNEMQNFQLDTSPNYNWCPLVFLTVKKYISPIKIHYTIWVRSWYDLETTAVNFHW